ncbi:MAG TPA: hypothetical protein VEJ41_06470 [Candidatus Acidoferrales bacterium]|nr:hypothetical protein [Candidatus Acidoferrales bacterium]
MIDPTVVRRLADRSYEVADDRVIVGASFGNTSAWIVGKATGAIQKMYSLRLGQDVFWSTVVTYGSERHHVLVGLELQPGAQMGVTGEDRGHVILSPVAPGTFEFHPGYQRHNFELPSDLCVSETVFVPRTGLDDPAVAYFVVDVTNRGKERWDLAIRAYTKLAGTTPKDMAARYEPGLQGLIASNASHPQWVRIVGASKPLAGCEVMSHAVESYDPLDAPNLSNDTSQTGDIIAAYGTTLSVEPGESERVVFLQAFSEEGESAARAIYDAAKDVDAALQRTNTYFENALTISQVVTPEKTINDGAYWAKANMLRVIALYPQGIGFTNSPGSSPNVVGRDLSWFTIGCDYLDPALSKAMLLTFAKTQYPTGKLPEYYDALTGRTEDYGLNINDDTPLFVLACTHHYELTGDAEFLQTIWPVIAAAADYILSQRDERGLVVCTARGEEVYGIAGWRNIIPNFSINGAVTEINSECHAALWAVSRMAKALARGTSDQQHLDAAERYGACAHRLGDAINQHLLNAQNGMYLLNIDMDGREHADVTGDEVFPVMFNVSPPAVSYRIMSRLNMPDFQTEAGLRTVSRLSPDYTPYRDVGLIGGVWPGLSFWYAFAAAKIYPDTMAHNLRQGYAQYLRDPKLYNTVPGQFSEWFDGESLVNRGMRLSPWEPPRYLWAAIEGACGLGLTDAPDCVRVAPLMPSGWRWLGVRRVPLGGRLCSYFAIRSGERFSVYANARFEVDGELETFDEDVSERIDLLDSDMVAVGFRRGDEWLVCVGSTLDVAYTFPLSLRRLVDGGKHYQVRIYNASLSRWIEGEQAGGQELRDIGLRIEAHSFTLARLVPISAGA